MTKRKPIGLTMENLDNALKTIINSDNDPEGIWIS